MRIMKRWFHWNPRMHHPRMHHPNHRASLRIPAPFHPQNEFNREPSNAQNAFPVP